MADAAKFNMRNPAVKRIMQEIKEIRQDTSGDILAEALENDIFEWHFVIRGPRDTEFEGGIYHGRILLPAEYPFKPPAFMMLTPTGRFETGVKICLSISSHHPEHWQPSWSVRTALVALIAFMPTPGQGALGSVDFPKEERKHMALKSRTEPPRFGSAERQKVVDEMHARMLALEEQRPSTSKAATTPAAADPAAPQPAQPTAAADPAQQAQQQQAQQEQATPSTAAEPASQQPLAVPVVQAPSQPPQPAAKAVAAAPQQPAPAAAGAAAPAAVFAAAAPAAPPALQAQLQAQAQAQHAASGTDHFLTLFMWALSVGIGAILLRKVMGIVGFDLADMLGN